jgi:hypothetical protein
LVTFSTFRPLDAIDDLAQSACGDPLFAAVMRSKHPAFFQIRHESFNESYADHRVMDRARAL